jgi:hypothetical protein
MMPESLAAIYGRRTFSRDYKAEGREGGRIVRTLIADVTECPLQDATTARPDTIPPNGRHRAALDRAAGSGHTPRRDGAV